MRITLMTPDQRAHFAGWLAGQNPAAPELLAAAVADANGGGGIGVNATASDMLAVAARLVEVEQLLGTTRETLARLAADGDDYALSDVLYELEQRGAGLRRAELDHAEHALDAVGRAGAF
ncbi:hypothetical protein [Streptomyces sp. NPDC006267]|uniref:hypothetical protein n=1 Tax=Streptomyces sp. NPDC006267 TaxID=3157173 RepID=UPI0033AA07AD